MPFLSLAHSSIPLDFQTTFQGFKSHTQTHVEIYNNNSNNNNPLGPHWSDSSFIPQGTVNAASLHSTGTRSGFLAPWYTDVVFKGRICEIPAAGRKQWHTSSIRHYWALHTHTDTRRSPHFCRLWNLATYGYLQNKEEYGIYQRAVMKCSNAYFRMFT